MSSAKVESEPEAARPPVALPPGTEALLDVHQIAAALGVSRRTVDGMVSSGEYPAADTKIGRFPRWRVSSHNAWLVRRCGPVRG